MSSLHIRNFNPQLHAALKLVCLKHKTPLERLVPQIISDWLRQHHDAFPEIPRDWLNPNRDKQSQGGSSCQNNKQP